MGVQPNGISGKYVKAREAALVCGVGRRTLFKWAKAGQIQYLRPGGNGHRLFDVSSVLPQSIYTSEEDEKVYAIYARVSTRKQMPDLQTQIKTLQSKYPGHIVFSDCASGLNFKRKGLQSLLQLAFKGRLQLVRIAHRDRLCRFAYDLIEFVLAKHGAKICVESDDMGPPSLERELAEDVISVVTVFGARLYGARSAGRKKAKEDIKSAPEPTGHGGSGGRTETQEAIPEKGSSLGWADADLQGLDAPHPSAEEGTQAVLCSVKAGVQLCKRVGRGRPKKDVYRVEEAVGGTY